MKPPPAPAAPPPHWLGRLNLATPSGAFSGERRIRLLEAIDEHGSITRCREGGAVVVHCGMDALDALNNLAERPLVARSAGGRQGGGTRLTDAGANSSRCTAPCRASSSRTLARVAPEPARGASAAQLQQWLQAQMRPGGSSARNQLPAAWRASSGAIGAEVIVELDEATRIVAGVTRESARARPRAGGAGARAREGIFGAARGRRGAHERATRSGTVSRVVKSAIGAEVTLGAARRAQRHRGHHRARAWIGSGWQRAGRRRRCSRRAA